jgi:Sulfotransferase domain
VKVIGAGFGRTGTLSLKLALEQLGFAPCYHMFEVVGRPERLQEWLDLADGGERDWSGTFSGYQAAVDWPASAFWRELTDTYPEAKVVLTVRDPDRWYDSIEKTLYAQYLQAREQNTLFARMVRPMIWDGIFGGRFDRESATDRFRQHVADVAEAVPAHRLLVFKTGEGWGPLCEFLDVPVPAEEFPRSNDSTSFQERIAKRQETGDAV